MTSSISSDFAAADQPQQQQQHHHHLQQKVQHQQEEEEDDNLVEYWEGEWTPLRHFISRSRRFACRFFSSTLMKSRSLNQNLSEKLDVALSHSQSLIDEAVIFKDKHPVAIVATLSALVALRSRNHRIPVIVRNSAFSFLAFSALLFPRQSVRFISSPSRELYMFWKKFKDDHQ